MEMTQANFQSNEITITSTHPLLEKHIGHASDRAEISLDHLRYLEFFTKETSCTNELSKRTTFEKNCQKGPPQSGGMTGLPAAWAKAGRHVPLGPTPACPLTGDAVDRHFQVWALPPQPLSA
jgi:hypothetical protein